MRADVEELAAAAGSLRAELTNVRAELAAATQARSAHITEVQPPAHRSREGELVATARREAEAREARALKRIQTLTSKLK